MAFKPPFTLEATGADIIYSRVDTIAYDKIGLLYYFMIRVILKDNKDYMFRITSKDPKFKSLYSVDPCSSTGELLDGIRIEDQKGDPSSLVATRLIYQTIKKVKFPNKVDKFEFSRHNFDANSLLAWISIITAVLTAGMMLYYYIMKVVKWHTQRKAETKVEREVNANLFAGQTGRETEFECYSTLVNSVKSVAHNPSIKSLIVCGMPGTSKTYMVRRTLHFEGLQPLKDYSILKGASMDMPSFVQALYDGRAPGFVTVLDDFDTPLESEELVNVLKSATDSYSRRVISYNMSHMVNINGGEEYSFPSKFEYAGKLIIITNKSMKSLDMALLSRSLTIEVNFTPEQFIKNIQVMLKYISPDTPIEVKEEVLDYIISLPPEKLSGLNFRTFQNAVSLRQMYQDWKPMVEAAL